MRDRASSLRRRRRPPVLVRAGVVAVAAVLVFWPGPGRSAPVDGPMVVLVDGQVGPAFLTKSRSLAIGHAFKPIARVGARVPLGPRLELGGALSAVMDTSKHYRVLGGLAHGRYAFWQRPAFSAGIGLALGVGYNADILHADLQAEAPAVPYGFLALDARWLSGRRWYLGAEGGWENLSIARLGLLFGARFDAVMTPTN